MTPTPKQLANAVRALAMDAVQAANSGHPGTTMGWERYTMARGLRFGVDGFGASAPARALYSHFGLTAAAIVPRVIAALNEYQGR